MSPKARTKSKDTPELVERAFLLDHWRPAGGNIAFVDATGQNDSRVLIPKEDFEAMGEPGNITVLVRPGDDVRKARDDNPVKRTEILEDNGGKWYMNFIGGNNEVLFTAEGHENQGDAVEIANRAFPGVPYKIVTRGGGDEDAEQE